MPRDSWTVHDHQVDATSRERVIVMIAEGKPEFIKVMDKEAATYGMLPATPVVAGNVTSRAAPTTSAMSEGSSQAWVVEWAFG